MAVEFALVLPVMAVMWLGTLMICQVYRADTALYNAAQSVANLAANEVVSVSGDIYNLCNDANLSLYPFPTSGNLTITVAEVTNTSKYSCPYYADFYASPPTPANPTSSNGCTLTVQYDNGSSPTWEYAASVSSAGACPTTTSTPAASFALPTDYKDLAYEPGDTVIEVQAQLAYRFGNFPILSELVGQSRNLSFFDLPQSFNLTAVAFSRPRNGTALTP